LIILVHKALVTLEKYRHPNLGALVSPRGGFRRDLLPSWRWAADNDAYAAWDHGRFVKMLDRIDGIPGCLFVAAPDVVGDAAATLERFAEWRHIRASQPLALVAQDGLTINTCPWSELDAIFVGGTSEWKLGFEAAGIVREAKRRGKWVHMGRVNTRRRIRYAKGIGCDSIDGTNFSQFTDTSLLWALQWAASEQQLVMTEGEEMTEQMQEEPTVEDVPLDPNPPEETHVTPRVGTDYVVLSLEQDTPGDGNVGSTWRVQLDSITAASADQAIRQFTEVGPQPGTFVAVPVRSFQRRTVVAQTVVTTRFATDDE
jgi:hypothetical protein